MDRVDPAGPTRHTPVVVSSHGQIFIITMEIEWVNMKNSLFLSTIFALLTLPPFLDLAAPLIARSQPFHIAPPPIPPPSAQDVYIYISVFFDFPFHQASIVDIITSPSWTCLNLLLLRWLKTKAGLIFHSFQVQHTITIPPLGQVHQVVIV